MNKAEWYIMIILEDPVSISTGLVIMLFRCVFFMYLSFFSLNTPFETFDCEFPLNKWFKSLGFAPYNWKQ